MSSDICSQVEGAEAGALLMGVTCECGAAWRVYSRATAGAGDMCLNATVSSGM